MSGIHIFGQELSKSPCQQVYSTNLDLNKSAAYFFQKKKDMQFFLYMYLHKALTR